MSSKPLFLILESSIDAVDLADTISVAYEALESSTLTPVLQWTKPGGSAFPFANAREAIVYFSGEKGDRKSTAIDLELGEVSSLLIHLTSKQEWSLTLTLSTSEVEVTEFTAMLQKMAVFCLDLLTKQKLKTAHISRKEVGLSCLPFVPIAKTYHLVVTTDVEVEQMYEQPESFWNANWSFRKKIGNKVLLLRGSHALDTAKYLSEIIHSQWNMARAAKPHLTEYFAPQITPEEKDIFYAGTSYLLPVAYIENEHEGENIVEYSAYIPENDHIHGWEIFNLRTLIQNGKMPNGQAVDTVRVVFHNREMAEREKRPLLDVGVSVYYQGADNIFEIQEGFLESADATNQESRAAAIVAIEIIRAQVMPILEAIALDPTGEFTAQLAPQDNDFERVFVGEAVPVARHAYQEIWAQNLRIQHPPSPQFETRCYAAPAGMLSEENELSFHFPSGYRAISHLLNPHRVWIAWKYVAPGEQAGLSLDGLVWIEDHWAWFPKPYRALRDLTQ